MPRQKGASGSCRSAPSMDDAAGCAADLKAVRGERTLRKFTRDTRPETVAAKKEAVAAEAMADTEKRVPMFMSVPVTSRLVSMLWLACASTHGVHISFAQGDNSLAAFWLCMHMLHSKATTRCPRMKLCPHGACMLPESVRAAATACMCVISLQEISLNSARSK